MTNSGVCRLSQRSSFCKKPAASKAMNLLFREKGSAVAGLPDFYIDSFELSTTRSYGYQREE
jgi:hypothetical protein